MTSRGLTGPDRKPNLAGWHSTVPGWRPVSSGRSVGGVHHVPGAELVVVVVLKVVEQPGGRARSRCPRSVPGLRLVRVRARARAGAHRLRPVATDRHVGPRRWEPGAIWHSNVPGTSPISAASGLAPASCQERKLPKGCKLGRRWVSRWA
jgi:hypothetical protein